MVAKLSFYNRRRNFQNTPEPEGKVKKEKPKALIFVVQKHQARTLHYDFRLEIGGVLRSWAVPKGLSTRAKEKRLAVETEDHPLTYADFEGIIPEGNYGAGKVEIWDKGTFANLKKDKPLERQADDGQIEVKLRGKKIFGNYALVRMKKEKQWLIFKISAAADKRKN